MTEAISGIGAKLRYLNGSVYEELGEVVKISGPSKSRATIDATHLGSTGGYKEFIGGLRDPGNVTFTLNFTRAAYDLVNTMFESDVLESYQLLLPDPENTSLEFDGLVTELPLNVPPEDRITCDVTIKVSGAVDVNSGSAVA